MRARGGDGGGEREMVTYVESHVERRRGDGAEHTATRRVRRRGERGRPDWTARDKDGGGGAVEH